MLIRDGAQREKYLGKWASDSNIELVESLVDGSMHYYARSNNMFSPFDGSICMRHFDKTAPRGLKYELLKGFAHEYTSRDADDARKFISADSDETLSKVSKLTCGCGAEYFSDKPAIFNRSSFEIKNLSKKLIIEFFTSIDKVVDLSLDENITKFARYLTDKYIIMSRTLDLLPEPPTYQILDEFSNALEINLAKLNIIMYSVLKHQGDIGDLIQTKIIEQHDDALDAYKRLSKIINSDEEREVMHKMVSTIV